MNIDLIIEFNVLAETLNFTEAARRLYLSQPTLSKHVSALEQEVGFTLVERQPTVRLTYAGREFHRKTAPLLDGLTERLAAAAAEVRECAAATKVLRVPDYTSVVEGYYGMMNTLKGRFDERYAPSVLKIEYVPVDQWRRLTVQECLEGGVVDILLWLESPRAQETDVVRAFDDAGYVVGSFSDCSVSLVLRRDHPLNAKERIGRDDLDGAVFFSHDESHIETALSRAMETLFASYDLSVERRKPFYSTDTVDMWSSIEIDDEVLFSLTASLSHFGFQEQSALIAREVEGLDLWLRACVVCKKEVPAHVQNALGLLGEI